MEFLKLPATREEALLTLGLAAAGPMLGKGLAAGAKALRGGKITTLADDAARAGSALRAVETGADAGSAAAKAGSNLGPAHRRTGVTVLGSNPDYILEGEKLGARYFSVPLKYWKELPKAEKWPANQRFLDRTIARGDDIKLANRPLDSESYLAREIEYLKMKGYVEDGSLRLVLRR